MARSENDAHPVHRPPGLFGLWTVEVIELFELLQEKWGGLRPGQPHEADKQRHRPITISVAARPTRTGDPEGGAQDVRGFSMRQDASSKNPDYASDGRFELDLSVFFGDFLDSRLRHSPFGPASPFAPHAAQCAKESYPRESAEALLLAADGYRYTQPIHLPAVRRKHLQFWASFAAGQDPPYEANQQHHRPINIQ